MLLLSITSLALAIAAIGISVYTLTVIDAFLTDHDQDKD